MKSNSFTALAISLATTITTPILAQSSSADSSAQEHSSQSTVAASEVSTPKEIRASKLLGINVTSKDGDSLGQVQDLILDPRTGKIRFALVGKGFTAGLGQSLIPVPWQAVKVHSEREFALNVDKEKMKSVPSWSQSEMDQPDYIIRVYRFYEIEPQSEVGGAGSSATESGQGQGGSSSSQDDNEHHHDSKE